jgi:pSer/pThr/pTyr-binding forkhead associated (FHA) protein
MEVKLVVMGGKRAGQEVPVPHSKFLIGRAEDCHLRPASDLVSRHHAVILIEEGFVAVRDFASRNGTFVNGQKIKNEQELKSGDHLKIGPLEFEVRLDVPISGKAGPKVHSVQEAAARTLETVTSASDEEVDISDLIGDDEDVPSETETAEAPLESTPTAGTHAADTAPIPEPHAEHPEGKKAETKKDKPTDFHSRLQAAKKRTAADSGSAADDVLRRFLGRKS